MSDTTTGAGNEENQKQIAAGAKTKKRKPPPPRPSAKVKKRNRRKTTTERSGCVRTVAVSTVLLALIGFLTLFVLLVPQRAELQLRGIASNVLVPNRPVQFIVTLYNSGDASAHVTTICGRFANLGTLGPRPRLLPGECHPLVSVVPGGKSANIDVAIAAPSFTPKIPLVMGSDITSAVTGGTRPAILFGQFVYRDEYSWILNPWGVFGPKELDFCCKYIAGDGPHWSSCNDPRYEN